MIVAHYLLNKMKEDAFVQFQKAIGSLFSSIQGYSYIFVSHNISNNSLESLYSILNAVGINKEPNSEDLQIINQIFSNSNLLTQDNVSQYRIQQADVVIAPFANDERDFVLLKKIESQVKCNIVVLLEGSLKSITPFLDDSDNLLDIYNVKSCFDNKIIFSNDAVSRNEARKWLLFSLKYNLSFKEYLSLFKDCMDSYGINEREKEKQFERIGNLEIYLE